MMTREIFKVSVLGKESIHCGFHLSHYIADTVLRTLPASTYVLLTDTHIASFHLDRYYSVFDAAIQSSRPSSRFLSKVIAPGETSKSREGKAQVEDFLLDHSCTRDTVLITMGGGVVGDLGGFVAATFMRGIRFVQIPTTLLAMVDSSVGGKTAIDTSHGKNLIGAFWQPEYVFIDASFLETLPAREVANGMAEVIKTAAIWNEEEFGKLETRSVEILAATEQRSSPSDSTRTLGQELLLSVIVGSISVKAHIVTIDERETGLRNLVNFGHTIGHALEAVLTPDVLHGECVSIGMILEAEIARQLGVLSQVAVGRLIRCLKAYKLPISVTDSLIASLPAADLLTSDVLLNIMKVDKKNVGNQKKIVLLKRIGATYEQKATSVDDEAIRRTLSPAIRVIPTTPKHPVRMAPPGSKSISNRAMVIAALGKGTVRITNLLHSDDTQVMMSALVELKGAEFSWEDGGETLVVKGGEGSLMVPPKGKELYLGNAGTASRFLATVCTLVRSNKPDDAIIITGNARMKERPIGPLVDSLRDNGCEVSYLGKEGSLPLSIAASPTGFKGSHIRLTANVSSQYVSSILLCAPYATEPVTLELVGGQVISQPYIDMTISMMKTFGVVVVREKDANGKPLDIYHIPKAAYINPPHYEVESDASSATYPLAIAAITGTSCTITNIGSSSLQGDAGFAKGVLEPMGCTVTQTETETTVVGPPPGQLKALGLVDMETMTDAFLTATALAAVAGSPPKPERHLEDAPYPCTSRILGISNQRVKECNRIRAMIDQLAKFGVDTKELEDGLEIYGRPIGQVKNGVSVHCYDDHRVAMAFSVLGVVVGGTILEEKRCVEKTWPNWWDDLGNKIGIPCEGVDLGVSSLSGPPGPSVVDPSATVFLIGMRGAGKSFIGHLAAETLGRKFVDADDWFSEKYGIPLATFVAKHGWPEFRKSEQALLQEALETKRDGHVISLGGGVLETPACRDLLKAYGREGGAVVYVVRDIDEIRAYLAEEKARPAWGESFEDVVKRRTPWFAEVANYEFVNFTKILHLPDRFRGRIGSLLITPDLRRDIKDEVGRFFRHISGVQPNFAANLEFRGRRSYFLSLTYPDITAAAPFMDRLTEGADAVEFRVDLLCSTGSPAKVPNVPSRSYVANQLAALRQLTPLPVVFTVRTVSQGGAFPDTAEKEAFELYDLAVKSGVEYIDVEITWNREKIQDFVRRKGSAKIISSYHDWSHNLKWNSDVVKGKYELAATFGDIVKIVGKANSIEDNFSLSTFQNHIAKRPGSKPLIAINMGQEGQLSRILNPTFSPISHPLLPTRAAPGQLSFAEIQKALHLIGQLPAQRYFLIGNPIRHSLSPTLHNTAHATLGFPHQYNLFETAEVDAEVEALLAQPDFGGASVTIPHKTAIIPLLSELSPHAKVIGAVNTVVPRVVDGKRDLYGDNTDWLAIRDLVVSNLVNPITPDTSGLIIGAGGTSRAAIYALHQLGIPHIYIYNRTQSAAHALSLSFPSEYNLTVIEALSGLPSSGPSVIVSTIPATAISTRLIEPGTLFLGKSIFSNPNGGVVIDMAYKPMDTPLLKLADEVSLELASQSRGSPPPGEHVPTVPQWTRVPGIVTLLEQGLYQFEMWTGRKAPREIVWSQVLEQYSVLC